MAWHDWVMYILMLVGGVCIFLFGMNVMGESLERRAGTALKTLLGKLTGNRFLGFLTGMIVTCVIQSSSATTVMVVGFVNTGLMGLPQAISVILGSNIGTTITAWILSTNSIGGATIVTKFLKPDAWTPILALIGIFLTMFLKGDKKKDTGNILLGFAVLMTGMTVMSDAVGNLDENVLKNIFMKADNPFLGVTIGTVLTAIIQSSSASVGILQSLAENNLISNGGAIPIIMGQNIGTCVTAIIACIGTNKNAQRAAFAHLFIKMIGVFVFLIPFCIVYWVVTPAYFAELASPVEIAIFHTTFNVLNTMLMFPMSTLIAKLAHVVIKDKDVKEENVLLDEKLFEVPAIALERSRVLAIELGKLSCQALKNSMIVLEEYDADIAKQVRIDEDKTDQYEDALSKYLVKFSGMQIGEEASLEVTKLLKAISDFERMGDHSINVLEAAEELKEKGLSFSDMAKEELRVLISALNKIMDLTMEAFTNNDLSIAENIEPLEEVIDRLKEQMRARHVVRMQQQKCSIEVGFVWVDLLTSLERVSDHCSNIAIGVIDDVRKRVNSHEFLHSVKLEENFKTKYAEYLEEYKITGDIG